MISSNKPYLKEIRAAVKAKQNTSKIFVSSEFRAITLVSKIETKTKGILRAK